MIACGSVDRAARGLLEQRGYGPGYALPGLPHRTGQTLFYPTELRRAGKDAQARPHEPG